MKNKFKAGDRVQIIKGSGIDYDYGVVVEHLGSIHSDYFADNIWVEWSNGEILHIDHKKIERFGNIDDFSSAIESCIVFLQSNGYTVTKD